MATSTTAQAKVKKTMEERKAGTLRSGTSGKKVTQQETGYCDRPF